MEGKDYVMADGDVVEFRFNVWAVRCVRSERCSWIGRVACWSSCAARSEGTPCLIG